MRVRKGLISELLTVGICGRRTTLLAWGDSSRELGMRVRETHTEREGVCVRVVKAF